MKKKETHWFSHDQNAFHDPKIELLPYKYGFSGYGRWWYLIEILRGEVDYKFPVTGKYPFLSLARKLCFTEQKVTEFVLDCIDFELLKTDGEYLWSDSLLARMEYWDKRREQLSEMGKKSAEVRKQKKLTAVEKNEEIPQPQLPVLVTNKTILNETKLNETIRKETKQNDDERNKKTSISNNSSSTTFLYASQEGTDPVNALSLHPGFATQSRYINKLPAWVNSS